MEKKVKIRSAAGARATSANIEARLTSDGKARKKKPPACPKNCSKLGVCPFNLRPCTGLLICGENYPPVARED